MRPQQPPHEQDLGRQPQQRQPRQLCRTAAPRVGFRPYHAANVPKSVDLRLLAPAPSPDEQTTVMLRNIPNRYTQAHLLQEIDEAGFEGKYDFFYLPMDTHNKTNVGYAFINFVCPDVMQKFVQSFLGYRFKDHASHKVARVSAAHLQGFWENVQHFSNRAVSHARNSQYRPIVVIQGQRMDMCEAVSRLLEEEYNRWLQQGYESVDCQAMLAEMHGPFPCSLTDLGSHAAEYAPAAMVADGGEDIPPSVQWLGGAAWGAPTDSLTAFDSAEAYDFAEGHDWGTDALDAWASGGDPQWPRGPWLTEGQSLTCGAPCDVAAVGESTGTQEAMVEGMAIMQSSEESASSTAAADWEQQQQSFSIDRSGLEKVMSQWLEDVGDEDDEDKVEQQEEADASSTAGDTRTVSSSASHRSLSPLVNKEASSCGVWDLPSVFVPQCGRGESPRKRSGRPGGSGK